MATSSLAVQLGITARTNPADAVYDVLRTLQTEDVQEVTIDTLAGAVGYSSRTVSRALTHLEQQGQITRERTGWRGTYCYEVNHD